MAPIGLGLNILHVIILFLAWVGTCVSFGGVLFTANVSLIGIPPYTTNVYYDHITTPGGSVKFSDIETSTADKCASGGRGFVAMQVFAFLALLAALVIVTLRLIGKSSLIPAFQTPAAALRGEIILTSIATFFYFLAVCIWGGTCFSHAGDLPGTSGATATGYAFVIVDFFFLMLDLILLWGILRNAAFQLGGDAEPKHQQHTDQPQINAHPNDQYIAQQQQQQQHMDPNLVELTCPSCAAKVTCPRGGQTNCAVCDAEISA